MINLEEKQKLYINGKWQEASSKQSLQSINPCNEQINTTISEANSEDVNLALHSALDAQKKYAQWDPTKVQNTLFRLGSLIQKNTEHLAALEMLETGKTPFDANKIEIPFAGEIFKYFSGWATKFTGTSQITSHAFKSTIKEPLGVVGVITPWNFPLLMASWKIAAALSMRNTVVVKPAESASLTTLCLAELANEAGFLPGTINVITGRGSITGDALVSHPDVAKISFTGSAQVGKHIMARASETLKPVSLELGGKSPNIIFEDADMKAALKGAFNGIFYNKGEVCAAGSRLLVQENIYEQVLDTLIGQAKNLKVGAPEEQGVRMGPLSNKEQYEKVLRYIELGQQEGAKLLSGGQRLPGKAKGFFVEPTIFADVTPNMQIFQEEIFGPVLTVTPFKDEQNAIQLANATTFGLAAGVWTKDTSRAMRLTSALDAGTVWVNAYNHLDASMPFGGFKGSGFGKELGAAALEQYSRTKSFWLAF